MLWIVGAIMLVTWFVGKFLLHKGGLVHVFMLTAVACFVIQFVQNRRTKAYYREQTGKDT